MNIKVLVQDISETTRTKLKKLEVKAYLPFEKFGYMFAVHRVYNGKKWKVSELSTGLCVSTGANTRKIALKEGHERLDFIGKEKVIKSIQRNTKEELQK